MCEPSSWRPSAVEIGNHLREENLLKLVTKSGTVRDGSYGGWGLQGGCLKFSTFDPKG